VLKILLKQNQSPGDILMLTAAVRDLKKAFPLFNINCKTSAQELWENNPYIDNTINEKNAD
jgi:ADP-heptose:LPS heptosyltransferase